jgi:hypothetical protein
MMTPKKLTSEEKSFVKFIKSLVGRRNVYTIGDALKSRGFKKVNEGGYKDVYKRTGDKFCVKVYQNEWGWQSDSYNVPDSLKDHFLYPIYNDKRFLIQPWVKYNYSENGYGKRKVQTLPVNVFLGGYDVKEDNVRVYRNREVVIDFCNTSGV